jgi:cell division transport system ATP-binding protein
MEKIVNAQNLVLGYKKQEPVMKGGNFSINKGEFVFLTGPSGSGKTTLIKSLYGDIRPLSGTLEVAGINMLKAGSGKLTSLRRKMGLVFQDYKLIEEWTIKKNVMLPLIIAGYAADICEQQTVKLLKHVKLTHKSENYPDELSGGEQQRVAVARALVHSPLIIVADEPTGNLDEYSAEVVMGLLKTAHACGITVLIATHHIPSRFDLPYKTLHIENGNIYEIP